MYSDHKSELIIHLICWTKMKYKISFFDCKYSGKPYCAPNQSFVSLHRDRKEELWYKSRNKQAWLSDTIAKRQL